MKFKVEITETLQKTIEVEADDRADAIILVRRKYRNEEIILDDTSYIDTEFHILEN